MHDTPLKQKKKNEALSTVVGKNVRQISVWLNLTFFGKVQCVAKVILIYAVDALKPR